jgi:hypothetical protein
MNNKTSIVIRSEKIAENKRSAVALNHVGIPFSDEF